MKKRFVFYGLALLFLLVVTFFLVLFLLSSVISIFKVHGISSSVLAVCSAIITSAILIIISLTTINTKEVRARHLTSTKNMLTY